MFQFQNGAIKRHIEIVNHEMLDRFNSKMVRLKVSFSYYGIHWHCCFNSKMVRLKESMDQRDRLDLVSFQFQNGAIKRL